MNGSREDSSKSSCQGNLGHPYQLGKKKIVRVWLETYLLIVIQIKEMLVFS